MMAARHIVIVFHDFSFGGTEVVALRLAREWVRMGRRVTILCGTLDGPLIGSIPAGVQVRTLDPEIGRSPLSRWRLRRALPAAIDRLRADILFLPGNFHVALGAAARLLPRRPKVVAKISNPVAPTNFSPLRWLFERLLRWAARDVDLFVAMSSGLAEDLERLAVASQICTIHDPNILTDLTDAQRAPRGPTLRLLAAGRLVAQKDFALAVRVTAQLARSRDVHLTILGEGPERARLANLAQRLGIAHAVTLAGHKSSIAPALCDADILLVTSRFEGGPAVAVEALSRAVPVIATDCSHLLYDLITQSDHGIILSTRNPEQVAANINTWFDNPDRKTFCGQAATAMLSTTRTAGQYLESFDRLVCGRELKDQMAALANSR